MNITCDTNVILSGLLFPGGAPDKIMQSVFIGKFKNHISPDMATELRKVLEKKFKLSQEKLKSLMAFVVGISELVYPSERLDVIQADPADNRILECALEANVDYIITGDKKHLLPLKKFKNIVIVSPATFCNQMGII